MIDQNIIFLWKEALTCEDDIIRTLAVINKWKLGLLFYRDILFHQLIWLNAIIKVAYGNILSTRHITEENTVLLEYVIVLFSVIYNSVLRFNSQCLCFSV